MNFQRLFGLLSKSRFFDDIIGHEHIKRLFGLALRSQGPNQILPSGPPGSSKTMVLMSLRQHPKDSYFVDGGNTTKAGIIDYSFKNRAPYLLEIRDLSQDSVPVILVLYIVPYDGYIHV